MPILKVIVGVPEKHYFTDLPKLLVFLSRSGLVLEYQVFKVEIKLGLVPSRDFPGKVGKVRNVGNAVSGIWLDSYLEFIGYIKNRAVHLDQLCSDPGFIIC